TAALASAAPTPERGLTPGPRRGRPPPGSWPGSPIEPPSSRSTHRVAGRAELNVLGSGCACPGSFPDCPWPAPARRRPPSSTSLAYSHLRGEAIALEERTAIQLEHRFNGAG